MVQNVWLVRHGERYDFVYPDWFLTAFRRYDPPLSNYGIIQARQVAHSLKCEQSENISHIFTSPFLRAIQTASEVAEVFDLPIKLEAGLGEWLNKDWMSETPLLQSQEELKLRYPRIDWQYNSLVIPSYPEDETTVKQRVGNTIKLIVNLYPENILIVGHSITVLGGVCALLNNNKIELKTAFCSLTKLQKYDLKWTREP